MGLPQKKLHGRVRAPRDERLRHGIWAGPSRGETK